MCIVHTDFFIKLLDWMIEDPVLVLVMILAIFAPIAFLFVLKMHWANMDVERKREFDAEILYQELLKLQDRLDRENDLRSTRERERGRKPHPRN